MGIDWLAIPVGIALASVVGTLVFFGVVVGLPVWLHHRRRMLELTGIQSEDVEELEAQIKGLEERCRKLEDQVLQLHTALADESRQLDLKLSEVLEEHKDEEKIQQQG